MQLHHIKAHGAFFAFLRDEPSVAEAVAKSIAAFGDVLLYWPAPAEGVAFCDAVLAEGIEIVEEIYPDLTYAPDGRLVIERHKQAADPGFAAAQVRQFLEDGTVTAERRLDEDLVPGRAQRVRARGRDQRGGRGARPWATPPGRPGASSRR